MRRRSLSGSILNREIAPLPPIVNPERRAKGKNDLKFFLKTYFPKKFQKPFGRHHRSYIDNIEYVVINGGKQSIAMPRGSGKSTIEKGAIPWAFGYGHRRSAVIVTATIDDACEFIDDIKKMLTGPIFAEDFPEIAYPLQRLNGSGHLARGQLFLGRPTDIQWESLRLKLPDVRWSLAAGAVVRSAGIRGKIRGRASATGAGETIRPDLVILDDLQKMEDAVNPDRVDKLEKIIESDVTGLAADGESPAMIMSCTVIARGDLADRYLDRKLKPTWNGLRFSMVEKFPDRMDLWEGEYDRLRKISDRKATAFYKRNREEMDAGAVVDWPENFNGKSEISRLQYAMNLLLENPESFWSERQNKPLDPSTGTTAVSAKTIRSRLNGLARRTVPLDTQGVTAFVDVHDDLLYYSVVAWSDDFTGYVVDYGTYPEQSLRAFRKGDRCLRTMKSEHGGRKKEDFIAFGLETLLRDLLALDLDMENDADGVEVVKIDKLLVDSGYVPKTIEAVVRKVGSPVVRPSFGLPIGAKKKPMAEWTSLKGASLKVGHYWLEDRMQSRSFRTVKVDTNYWKTYVHEAFDLAVGTPGGLSLWGDRGEAHRMFSEHLDGESVRLVEVGSRKVDEWSQKPNRDNHFFDCVVGCAVAASTLGIKTAVERDAAKPVSRQRRR